MILISGAAGKTGQAITKRLAEHAQPVRTWVRRTEQLGTLQRLGADQVVIGDITNADDWTQATDHVETIYHICPNMHPQEISIGQKLIEAARKNGVRRIVYHSVLHPQIEEMPHHWNKMRVEELLFKSGLDYTILQPAAYMQNILAYRKAISESGHYPVPYAVETRIGMVDLNEVAEVAAQIIVNPKHSGAIYELASEEALSQIEVAQTLSTVIGQPIRAEAVDRATWAQRVRQNGMSEYAIATLLSMFEYYERYGFWGNSSVMEMLLGRKPRSFADWAALQEWDNDTAG